MKTEFPLRITTSCHPREFLLFILILVSPALFAGCASDPEWSEAAKRQQTSTGVRVGPDAGIPEKPSVEYIRVRMTDTVFLAPPEVDNPGIFLRVRNTSGKEALDLHGTVAPRLEALGYRLVNNAKDAVYVMQANILFADEVSAAELAKLDETEFGTDVGRDFQGDYQSYLQFALYETLDANETSNVGGSFARRDGRLDYLIACRAEIEPRVISLPGYTSPDARQQGCYVQRVEGSVQ